jgi:hypothetical protein
MTRGDGGPEQGQKKRVREVTRREMKRPRVGQRRVIKCQPMNGQT